MKTSFDSTEKSKEKRKLTIDELRKFKGLENLSDEDAQETIDSLEVMAIAIFSIYNSKILKNEKSFDEV